LPGFAAGEDVEQEPDQDSYLQGYIESWLLHVHGIAPSSVTVAVEAGVVTLSGRYDGPADIGEMVAAVAAFPGVREVINRVSRSPEDPGAATVRQRRWSSWFRWLRPAEGRKTVRFPEGDLFTAPLADQKQPRFHMTYQRYALDFGHFNVASVGFGENVGLIRIPHEREGDGWQLSISGAVFAIFNLDADSKDLLNADYYIGFPLSWRSGPVSARVRLFHLSSHLGDEFLLSPQPGPPVERINLSYEAVELLASYERRGFRMYGGGIRILHSDTQLGRDRAQLGVEFISRLRGRLRFRWIAGLDVQAWDETGWDRDVSVKAGLRLPSPYRGNRWVSLLAEYYDGHVPHGQFFNLQTDYFGLGISFSL
jgi:hypothetical protein